MKTETPFKKGKKYFIRTVTHHHTGLCNGTTGDFLRLTKAAWIADDGRLTLAISTGKFNEIEMFPTNAEVFIGLGSIIDAVELKIDLPTSQK